MQLLLFLIAGLKPKTAPLFTYWTVWYVRIHIYQVNTKPAVLVSTFDLHQHLLQKHYA